MTKDILDSLVFCVSDNAIVFLLHLKPVQIPQESVASQAACAPAASIVDLIHVPCLEFH